MDCTALYFNQSRIVFVSKRKPTLSQSVHLSGMFSERGLKCSSLFFNFILGCAIEYQEKESTLDIPRFKCSSFSNSSSHSVMGGPARIPSP